MDEKEKATVGEVAGGVPASDIDTILKAVASTAAKAFASDAA